MKKTLRNKIFYIIITCIILPVIVGVVLKYIHFPKQTENLQVMENSPGGVQAGRNVIIENFNVSTKDGKVKDKTSNTLQLLPSEIIEKISAYPLLQQDDAIKYYIGLQVEWDLTLSSLSKIDNDHVSVVLRDKESLAVVHCIASLNENKKLGILEKGAPIKVYGKISKIIRIHILLESVKLIIK